VSGGEIQCTTRYNRGGLRRLFVGERVGASLDQLGYIFRRDLRETGIAGSREVVVDVQPIAVACVSSDS
jgi:hypothetical protein